MLDVRPIPAFDDNYIWVLRNPGASVVAVVDPGDEEPVFESLRHDGLELGAILITHKHGDHAGGVKELLDKWPGIPVYGPANEPIPAVGVKVKDGDRINLPGIDGEITVLEVPGHTEGHVAYYTDGLLFCGDTLFTAGCGRVFSGSHEQLYASSQRIAALPGDTLVYCAHEYTSDNLGFAKWVEPDNPRLAQRCVEVDELRGRGEPTVPSTLQTELDTNPFLRSGQAEVIAAAEKYAGRSLKLGSEVFTAIRNWKDREYD